VPEIYSQQRFGAVSIRFAVFADEASDADVVFFGRGKCANAPKFGEHHVIKQSVTLRPDTLRPAD
jgi:hypothetical protein